jgi:ABC-type glutathione transport system ATPase component
LARRNQTIRHGPGSTALIRTRTHHRRYSTGNPRGADPPPRCRVTIILSTLLNPSLLVADEVTSALDVSTHRAVGEMLLEFRDRGFVKSVIAITHDLSILAQIADGTLVMYAGRLAEKASTGSARTVSFRPAAPLSGQLRTWTYTAAGQNATNSAIVAGTASASAFAHGVSLPPESMVILGAR